MRARSSWPKVDLVMLAVDMILRGYEFPFDQWEATHQNKQFLADCINDAERPSIAFGANVSDLIIEKDVRAWAWIVKRMDGRRLCVVSFTEVYEWAKGAHSPDFLAALEVCMVREPLDLEDEARLEQNRPGITSKAAFEVDWESWEVEDEPDPVPVVVQRPPAPEPKEEPRPVSPKRKIRL